MKKYIGISFVIASMLAPVLVSAQQTDTPPAGAIQCANLAVSFGYGARDNTSVANVSMLQDFLSTNGYLKVTPNGFFGKGTLAAVKAFQSANGITPTGYVGPYTRAKIQQIDCVSTSTSTSPSTTQSSGVVQSNTTNNASVQSAANSSSSVQSNSILTPSSSAHSANIMSQSQAQTFVSALGISGSSAQALIGALTSPSIGTQAEGMHLSDSNAEGMHLLNTIISGLATSSIDTISVTAPNIVVNGKNLAGVKVYAVGSGTGVTAGTLLGYATLQSTGTSGDMNGEQTWTYTPTAGSYTQIYAQGYSVGGQLVGTVTLSITGVTPIYNALWGTTTTPNTTATTTTGVAANTTGLTTFNETTGVFLATSYGLSMVKVYYVPTGTGVTTGVLIGSMGLEGTGTSNDAQYWSLQAPITPLLATSVYAIGYTPDTQMNQITAPYTGPGNINAHLN